MISITLPLLGLAALSAAQQSEVSLFIPNVDSQSLVASIAGSDATATTYVVGCASQTAASTSVTASASASASASGIDNLNYNNSDNSKCSFPSVFTVTEGPSTVHYSVAFSSADTPYIDCSLSGSTYAVCNAIETDRGLLTTFTITTLTGAEASSQYLPVTITAGSVKGAASAVSATTTGTATKETSTATGTAKSGSSTGTSSTSMTARSTNAAATGAPILGAGMLGAFGAAVAGALL